MKIKSLSFMGIILATVLLSSTFFVTITVSEFPSDPPGVYSPWADLNDDGEIDIFDVVWMAGRYGETGTEVNKTALLYDVSHTFDMLLDKISALNSTVIEQQTIINNLNSTVILLNETVAIMNSTGLGAPDYDSGWQSMPESTPGIALTHNLGTTNIVVYLCGKYDLGSIWVHQCSFGGDQRYLDGGEVGVWWAANNATINVYRGAQDHHAGMPWGYVRVKIWKIPQP